MQSTHRARKKTYGYSATVVGDGEIQQLNARADRFEPVERLSFTFMSNGKREFVPRDHVSHLSFTVRYFYT